MTMFVNPLFEIKRSSDWHNLYFNHESARRKHKNEKLSGKLIETSSNDKGFTKIYNNPAA